MARKEGKRLRSQLSRHVTRRLITQIIKYLISGGVYFWSGYAFFAVLWSGFHMSLWWAKLAANVFGWSVNFLLQRYWVFRTKSLTEYRLRVTGRYIAITLVDFLIDYLIVAGLKTVGITPYIGQFVSAAFFTFWNYFWYRFWVFPEDIKQTNKGEANGR